MMIRIVFVDDEVLLLKAMRSVMRGMRNEWDMDFCSDGVAALDSLAKRSADVIVSDMSMPRMDGVQLLTAVKARYPQTIRIVLSGDAVPRVRSADAHDFLEKPCGSDTLKEVIEQALALRGVQERRLGLYKNNPA